MGSRFPWWPIALCAFGLLSVGGFFAVRFAADYKPWTLAPTAGGYAIYAALVYGFGRVHRQRRIFFATHIWLTLIFFSGVLGFVHLEDIASQRVWSNGGFVDRPEQPVLLASVFCLGGILALLSMYLLWLGRRRPWS